ncbi:MAG: DUF1549 domain-containing protein [Planctomycetales bacterium]|nr:DUF1549 domain-containing protein [Planctomycetales bacterium]
MITTKLPFLRCWALIFTMLAFCDTSNASEPDSDSMTRRIDSYLEAAMLAHHCVPAPICDDGTFIRRAYLDVTGLPPTGREVLEFMADDRLEKRDLLINRLLRSPGSANHLANTWAQWLLPDELVGARRGGLTEWLRDRFAENLRYDRMVADLLTASGDAETGPTAYFVSLEASPEKIAAKTSRVFLGVQLECAQCHDHPFDRWSQKDFWGFAAYFAQLNRDLVSGGMANAAIRDLEQGEVTLPNTEVVVAPKPLVSSGLSGLQSGTRREQLTLWLTARENPYLARCTVNRVWALLFGRGLVEPIDDMRPANEATHPELLDELAEYFVASGYDLRDLFQTIASTQAYQRAVIHPDGSPPVESYAAMINKPMTALQIAESVNVVARQVVGNPNELQAIASQLGNLRGEASAAQLGIVSALVVLHGNVIDSISRENSSRLLKALEAPFLDQQSRIRWLYLATVNRAPNDQELHACLDSLRLTLDDLSEGEIVAAESQWLSDLLWALVNSTEFALVP